MQNTRKVLDKIISDFSIEGILSLLENSAKERDAIMLDSYKHHNDFTVIELTKLFDYNERIRLHFWHPEICRSEARPHSHPWFFSSCILNGRLNQTFYEVRKNSNKYNKYNCYSLPDRKGYLYNLTEETEIDKVLEQEMGRGCIYSVDPQLIHSVQGGKGEFTITLVVLGNYVNRNTSVFYPVNMLPPNISPNNYFTADTFKSEIKLLSKIYEKHSKSILEQ